MDLFHKILAGMANSVDPDQTALSRDLIWDFAVCIRHFARKVVIQNFRTVTVSF